MTRRVRVPLPDGVALYGSARNNILRSSSRAPTSCARRTLARRPGTVWSADQLYDAFQSWGHAGRSGGLTPISTAFAPSGLTGPVISDQLHDGPKSEHSSIEPRYQWPDGKKKAVAPLEGHDDTWQRSRQSDPAPSRQNTPDCDECCRAGENTPVSCANVEALHCMRPSHAFRSYGAGLRDVGKAKRLVLIPALVVPDLCATEGTGPIEVHHRFRNQWLHATGPGSQSSTD